MSHPQPYGVPFPPPRKPRPSGRWFVVGGVMVAAAVAIVVVLIVLAVKDFAKVDTTVPADGLTVQVALDPGTTYLVWDDADRSDACRFADASGAAVTPRGLGSASYDRSGGSGSWTGAAYLGPGLSSVSVTCHDTGGPIQIGPKPKVGHLVGLILASVAVGLLLGGGGLVVLIVTGILFATRPRREGPPPGVTPAR